MTIKKLFAISIIALTLASCKKDRTCECTYTSTSGGSSQVTTETVTIKKIKKSEAKNLCQKRTYTSTSSGSSSTYTYINDCKLKK